jgi:hypothetical protein
MLAADRERHNNKERLSTEMRTLEDNEHGTVGNQRAIHDDKELTKLNQTQKQCAKLMEQMGADCSAVLQEYGGKEHNSLGGMWVTQIDGRC